MLMFLYQVSRDMTLLKYCMTSGKLFGGTDACLWLEELMRRQNYLYEAYEKVFSADLISKLNTLVSRCDISDHNLFLWKVSLLL